MNNELAVTIVLVGVLVVVPIVVLLLRHQHKMTELIHKNHNPQHQDELLGKLSEIQNDMSELRNRQNELILSQNDDPALTPRVEERIQD